MHPAIRDCLLADLFPDLAAGLRALELDAIELELDDGFRLRNFEGAGWSAMRGAADVTAYRDRLGAAGVRVAALLTARDLSVGEEGEDIEWLARAVQIAHLLGAPAVRVDALMINEAEIDFERRAGIFAEVLGEVLARTEGVDTALAIENHGREGNNPVWLLTVLRALDSPRAGLTLDPGNFYWRGYPLSEVYGILRLLAPYTRHTHIKNIDYTAAGSERQRETGWEYAAHVCPIDQGDIDYLRVLRMLRDAGYDGALCIEDESLFRHEEAERAEVLRMDVAHLRGLLDKLAKERR